MPNRRKHPSQIDEKSLKHNRNRYKDRENQPETEDLDPEAPEYLSDEQKAVWDELVGRIAQGVLKRSDVYVLELTTRLTVLMRKDDLSATQVAQYRGCLASLGMTPADRARIKAEPKPEKSLLDMLLDGPDDPGEI